MCIRDRAYITLAPGSQNLTYVANTPYKIKVYTTDLENGLGDSITADNLELQGGEIGAATPFAGAGEGLSQYLIGGAALTRNPNPTWNNTGINFVDSVAGEILITWYCDIPFVAESVYTGTTTYVIEQ